MAEQNYSEIWKKMVAATAGAPVDLFNMVATPVANTVDKFRAISKHEALPKEREQFIHTGSSKDIRERAGVTSEDTLLDIVLQMLSPVPGTSAKAAASAPAIIGAFRNAGDSAIGRNLIEALKKGLEAKPANSTRMEGLDAGRTMDDAMAQQDIVLQSVANKVTNKELAKYGTPEFVLDKFLPSTKSGRTTPPWGVEQKNIEDILSNPASENIRLFNKNRAELSPEEAATKMTKGDFDDLARESETLDGLLSRMILEGSNQVQDFTKAQKEGKKLYDMASDSSYPQQKEMSGAVRNLVRDARELGIPEETISGKTLPQLVSVVKEEADKAKKILLKNQEVIAKNINGRTAKLREEQVNMYPEGFVRLEDPLDLSQETYRMNHCIGASCSDGGKYQPAHDVATGELSKKYQDIKAKYPNDPTSFDTYSGRLKSGESDFFSYRPSSDLNEGFTVELFTNDRGIKEVRQAYGPKDRPLREEEQEKLDELLQFWNADVGDGKAGVDAGMDDIIGMINRGELQNPRVNAVDDEADAVWDLQHPEYLDNQI